MLVETSDGSWSQITITEQWVSFCSFSKVMDGEFNFCFPWLCPMD